ncbi:MAG: DNA polymerase III subunit delta [Paracoccaceae bacterium]|nr:DNA polymerase III subunit delta [Paracoccaceae bacterium]
MKLNSRDIAAYFRDPDRSAAGALLYGEDAMRVALKRQELVAALIGPEGEAEMRLARIAAADLRKDSAALLDAVKAQGFFPGPRVAFVEDATDGLAPVIKTALEDWREGDAQIIVTAGQLNARSALRKLFEGHARAYAVPLYNNPPTRAEIEAELTRAGLREMGRDAMAALEALARSLTPGDFRQTLEKTALYKRGDDTPLTPDEVALNAPATIEAEIDEIYHVLAEGRTADIAPVMQRLAGQGVAPVTLLIMGERHFRTLYAIASAPGGPAQGIGKLRPPIFGPRRDRMLRQAQAWSIEGLEQALRLLMDTDLTLRSAAQRAPAMALVERAFVRLAYLYRR